MGRAWGIGLLAGLLLTTALAPVASAGLTECTTIRYSATSGIGGTISWCPGGIQHDPDEGSPGTPSGPGIPPVPDVPGLPPTPEPPSFSPSPGGVGDITFHSCPEGFTGFSFRHDGKDTFVCAEWMVLVPSGPLVPHPELPEFDGGIEPSVETCDPYSIAGGVILTQGQTRVGFCFTFQVVPPTDPNDKHVAFDLSRCSMPNMGGEDPAFWFFGGGVAVCYAIVFERGPLGVTAPTPSPGPVPVEVDTRPCARHATDPAIKYQDGGVWVCVLVGVREDPPKES